MEVRRNPTRDTPFIYRKVISKSFTRQHHAYHTKHRTFQTHAFFGWLDFQTMNKKDTSSPTNENMNPTPIIESHPIQEVSIIYENQRWLGVTWQPPLAALDHPAWSDAHGNPIFLDTTMDFPPSSDNPHWQLVITPGTDEEGWQYATVFQHLQYKRSGGRASQRLGDIVRRRAWQRIITTTTTTTTSTSIPPLSSSSSPTIQSPQSQQQQSKLIIDATATKTANAQRIADAKKRAVRSFINSIIDLLSRRKLWTLVPWDPTAFFSIFKKHKEIYQKLQEQAFERQLFTPNSPPSPSILHPQSQHPGSTLLQDLLCAALHSRASYGFAMQAGHIRSVEAYVRLQTLQRLKWDAAAGASAEANDDAVMALAGIQSPDDILLSHWRNSPFRPCHYVAIDRANQCIVISIRGSLEMGDLLSDVAAHPMEVTLLGVEGWVHQGIFVAATYIQCITQSALEEAARRCPGWPLLITGHSLGGGVAAILSMLLKDTMDSSNNSKSGGGDSKSGNSDTTTTINNNDNTPDNNNDKQQPQRIHCITIGTAAVMSESLAAACEPFVTSLVVGSDAVPHLSLASVENLLMEVSEASPVRRVAEDIGNKLSSLFNSISFSTAATSSTVGGSSSSGSNVKWSTGGSGNSSNNSNSKRGLGEIATLASTTTSKIPPPTTINTTTTTNNNKYNSSSIGVKSIPIIDLNEQNDQILEQHHSDDKNKNTTNNNNRIDTNTTNHPSPSSSSTNTTNTINTNKVMVPILLDPGHDAILASTAMIQQHITTTNTTMNNNSNTTNSNGHPELLFPPGKILWIFPNDEDINSLTQQQPQQPQDNNSNNSNSNSNNSGSGNNDVVDMTSMMAEDMDTAWSMMWSGVHSNSNNMSNSNNNNSSENNNNKKKRSKSAVDLGEAFEEEERKNIHQDDTAHRKNTVLPVVAVAHRGSFERLLLLPDMLTDHLPDRYLDALKQL